MQRTGNTTGAEGRRQHNEDDPSQGDRQHRQERLAEKEIQEGIQEVAENRRAEGSDAAEEAGDGTESRDGSAVGDPQGVKPVTERRIEDAEPRQE